MSDVKHASDYKADEIKALLPELDLEAAQRFIQEETAQDKVRDTVVSGLVERINELTIEKVDTGTYKLEPETGYTLGLGDREVELHSDDDGHVEVTNTDELMLVEYFDGTKVVKSSPAYVNKKTEDPDA